MFDNRWRNLSKKKIKYTIKLEIINEKIYLYRNVLRIQQNIFSNII